MRSTSSFLRARFAALIVPFLFVSSADAWFASYGSSPGPDSSAIAIDQEGNVFHGGHPPRKVSGADGSEIAKQPDSESFYSNGIAVGPFAYAAMTNGFETVLFDFSGSPSNPLRFWVHDESHGGNRIAVAGNSDVVVGAYGFVTRLDSDTGAPNWSMVGGDSPEFAIDASDDVLIKSQVPMKVDGDLGFVVWYNQNTVTTGSAAMNPAGDFFVAGISPDIPDFTVVKLTASYGTESWRTSFASDPLSGAQPRTAVTDASGDLLVLGRVSDSSNDHFVLKLDGVTGQELWRYTLATVEETDGAWDLAIDGAGDAFVAATGAGMFTIIKFDGGSGSPIWQESPGAGFAYAVEVDHFGDVVAGGDVGAFGVLKLRGASGDDYFPDCGNASIEVDEECDDGGLTNADGCDSTCDLEPFDQTAMGSVSTGFDASDPSPVHASVTSPSGGSVGIARTTSVAQLYSYGTAGVGFAVSGPVEPATDPLVLSFLIEHRIVPMGKSFLAFKDGAAVPECEGVAGDATPDPCMSERTELMNGDVQLTVLATSGGQWSFGFSFNGYGATCGNHRVDIREQCDDGNLADGDCCTSGCRFPVALDGTCSAASKSALSIERDPSGIANRLRWKWKSTDAFSVGDFGSPETSTPLSMCVYDGDGNVIHADAPASGTCAGSPCWRMDVARGKAEYRDDEPTPEGFARMKAKSGDAGRGKILVDGRGTNLRLADDDVLALPVRARLLRGDGMPGCWEANFSNPERVSSNEAARFKAKSD